MATKIQIRRDTSAIWSTTNPILAQGEPGLEIDTSRIKYGDGITAWNDLSYSTTVDVTRPKLGWINVLGPTPNDVHSYWYDSVVSDADGNSYYAGGDFEDHKPKVVKINIAGEIQWQTKLNDFDGYEGAANSITIDPTNNQLVVLADNFKNTSPADDVGLMVYRLNPATGALISSNVTRWRDDTPDVDGNYAWLWPKDITVDNTGNSIFVASQGNERVAFPITAQAGSGDNVLVIDADDIPNGIYPRNYSNTWWAYDGTEGYNTLTVNQYANASGTSTSALGEGALFDISFTIINGQPIKTVTIANQGTNYEVNDVITILGTDIGGTSPTNDCVITVTQVSGGLITGRSFIWTPDTSKVKLDLNGWGGTKTWAEDSTTYFLHVAFNQQLIAVKPGSWAKTIGDVLSDYSTSVTVDSNRNVYIAGHHENDNPSDTVQSMLIKLNQNGTKQWAKSFDYDGFEGFYDGYNSVVVDSEDNIIVSQNNDSGDANVITKVSPSGVIIWQRTLGVGDLMTMWNIALAVDADDNIYVASETDSASTPTDDYQLLKISKTGALVWQRAIGSTDNENAYFMAGQKLLSVSADRLFISGSTELYSTWNNFYDNAVAISVPTDGTGIGTIANTEWTYRETNWAWDSVPEGDLLVTDLDVNIRDLSLDTDTITPTISYPTTNETRIYIQNSTDESLGAITGVNTIVFEDGSVQNTAAGPSVPGILKNPLTGYDTLRLQLAHNGKHIRLFGLNDNVTLRVPSDAEVDFPIGAVITIVVDNFDGHSFFITGHSSVTVIAAGYNIWDIRDWRCAGDGNADIYTLMKLDSNRWIISGPVIVAND